MAKRSSSRRLALALGAVLIVVAAVLIAKSVGGSSGTKGAATTSVSTAGHSAAAHHAKPHTKASAKVSTGNPAETVVDVLNGTSTTGLAHRLAGDLQKSGYSQATALAGRPAGSNQATIVQYAAGHQGDAQAVAHSIAALAPAATVVVIVGLDKASAGGGEESSGGGATAVP